ERAEITTRHAAQRVGCGADALFPVTLDPRSIPLDLRHRGAIGGRQALVAVAVAVGQPAFVDRLVVARHRAQHFTAPRVQPQVRAERIVVTDRFAREQFPCARTEPEYLVGQCADRAHVDDVAGNLAGERLADPGADLEILGAPHAAEFVRTGDLAHDPDAARTLDATRHLGRHERAEVLVRDHALALDEARNRTPVAERQILQLAFATLVADRAIERMVYEQELHDVALRRQRARGLGGDLHAIRDRRSACGLRFRHRLAAELDFDHAHAAVRRNRELAVVAEARDRDTRV